MSSQEGFEKWAKGSGYYAHTWGNMEIGWQARQPEIDALKLALEGAGVENNLLRGEIDALKAEHFNVDDSAQEFDTVSGEPGNWLHSMKDDDCTMIENGGIAKSVLQGKDIHEDANSQPIKGEVFGAMPPTQEDEPVGDVTISHHKGLENRDFDYYGNLPDGTHKLYTRPQGDELRKAAEKSERLLTNLESGLGFEIDEEYAVLENLRAALRQGK